MNIKTSDMELRREISDPWGNTVPL